MSKKRAQNCHGDPLTPTEMLIKEKGKKFVQAIKEYWKEQDKLQEIFDDTALSFGGIGKGEEMFPRDLSSLIWLIRDGAVFIRYKTEGSKKDFKIRVADMNLIDWFERGWIIPIGGRDISLSDIIQGPANNVTFKRCTFDGVFIEFANFSYVRYDQTDLAPSLSKALLDFRLTTLGMILQAGGAIVSPKCEQLILPDKVADNLQQKLEELKKLLNDKVDEEKLQIYLKQNPFLLKPSSESISKKNLGEDFITDFVLLNISDQGPVYTFVELKRSSYQILTKEGCLTSPVNGAIKKTRDWDIWFEKNKSYLQNRLPGFESPQYLIVIGRTREMTESEKAYLRSYNRGFKHLSIMTYDDIVTQTEEFLASLKSTLAK